MSRNFAETNSIRRNVFKKSSPNMKIAVYLGKRDFFDDLSQVDPIDGLVWVDTDYKGRQVYARIECCFRYGREDMDGVMSGVVFKRDFFLKTSQVYPQIYELKNPTQIQERLLKRFPGQVFPFRFDLPHDIPLSIMLQPHSDESADNQPCGIEYNLQIYVGDSEDSLPARHNSVRILIRRLTTAIPNRDNQPYTKELHKIFHLHSGSINTEATLPKDIFFHNECLPVTLTIDNMSSNSVRRIKLQVIQVAEITLFRLQTFKTVVFEIETDNQGFPIEAGQSGWSHTFRLYPTLEGNRYKTGLALDGKMKHQDTNLASSTLIKDHRKKDMMGIIVQYLVRIKLITGFGGRDTEMEIPFVLTHPSKKQEKSTTAEKEEIVIEKFDRVKVKLLETNSVDKNDM